MLTDIFAYRYSNYPLWESFTENERRLVNQCFGIVQEAIPYYGSDGKEIESSKVKWKALHDKLARELGVDELSPRYYSYTHNNGFSNMPVSGFWPWSHVCAKFVKAEFKPGFHVADSFIKERISFIELAMRQRDEEVHILNANLLSDQLEAKLRDLGPGIGKRLPRNSAERVNAWNEKKNEAFASQIEELNERFRRAKTPLNYHNGYIQVSVDNVIEQNIEKPFWNIVADSMWKNVDIDMKEALDRRDSNDKDPAIFAAKALESAIKIVSDKNGWTKGNEKGAANFIDNLVSKANGAFLTPWEGDMLKDYFRKVRNSLGHGPGSDPMPVLEIYQTDWAIETAMSWVRTILRRQK